ncbi:hypothetical protein [Salinimicrobium terrae]|uniref:hypothetical protein n=1 Tax=Salinimicrobium terrae TaxID=470866 RepID=UPI0004012124|nr:hypothetical protein [Salinimicrobium terrae]
MKSFFTLSLIFSFCAAFSQTVVSGSAAKKFQQDTLITVKANPEAGFAYDYLLYIPKGLQKEKKTWLLVEPNNTGFTSDSIEVHRKAAMFVATERSIGNNVSTEMKIPFLVPIFPRPKAHDLVYTHALDRDALLVENENFENLDLQLVAMIKDVSSRLKELKIPVAEKVLMSGFSASGSFVNRFLFLHPEIVKAASVGGLNGILMLPKKVMNGHELNYPLGINDLQEISGREVNLKEYRKIPQFLFMGALDNNDAVPFDDAYNDAERSVIYATVGRQMQPERWENCQEIYKEEGVNAEFRTYAEVGHWSTGEINLEVIRFFMKNIQK